MKIGLLITSIGDFGQKGFYNSQEIGMAKALDKYFDSVTIYKLVPKTQQKSTEHISDCKNVTLEMIPAQSVGTNGIFDVSVLDKTLDALIYFSDTQISLPKIYSWAIKNNIKFFSFIGVLESHSTSAFKKFIIDSLFKRNLAVYKKCKCLVKTPFVEKQLRDMGVNDITVTPVGLDLTLLNNNYKNVSKYELKQKYGFNSSDKVLLYIGRLIDEKQPLRMIDILSEILKKDTDYRLLMVGTGPLKESVDLKIDELNVGEYVQQIERIPNCDIWELYKMADCFVNLNQQEIFGMAILEAMYYECNVVAWKAPGPKFIIEDGVSGYLVDSNDLAIEKIINGSDLGEKAHSRIINKFTWENTAKIITDLTEA